MRYQFQSGYVLVAPLDLESRKPREERACKSAAVLKHPRHAGIIRRRGHLSKSLHLVERDGEVLLRTWEMEIESPEGSATGPMAKWLHAFLPPRVKKNPGLPLELAFAKMRLPGRMKNDETDLLSS